MSYILDALRKADAERARGAVPDLHAQPVLRSSAGAAPATGAQPWAWVTGAIAVTAVCGLAWALLTRDVGRESATAAAPAALPPAVITAPMNAPPSAPGQLAPAPTRPPPARTVARPVIDAVRPAPRKPVADSTGLPPPAAATPSPTQAQPDAAARPAEPRLYTQAELPDEIRRALPALAIGGAMYSEHAASRMLIINGQVFHERDKLAPNLTLVQIRLKTAVLDYRGYRYSVSY